MTVDAGPVRDTLEAGIPTPRTSAGGGPGAGGGPRRAPFVLLVLTLLGAGLCALLALNTATAASEVRERQLDATNSGLTDSEQQLSRDVAALQAPDNLARQAAKLGLIPADAPAFIKINADGSATVLGKPAPAQVPVEVKPKTEKQIAAEKKAQRKAKKAKARKSAETRKKADKKAADKKAAAKKAAAKKAAAKKAADKKAADKKAAKNGGKKSDKKKPAAKKSDAKKSDANKSDTKPSGTSATSTRIYATGNLR